MCCLCEVAQPWARGRYGDRYPAERLVHRFNEDGSYASSKVEDGELGEACILVRPLAPPGEHPTGDHAVALDPFRSLAVPLVLCTPPLALLLILE